MHALRGMLSYFHCLASSYGPAKTIRISHVWTRIILKTEEEISVIKNIRIRVDGTLHEEPVLSRQAPLLLKERCMMRQKRLRKGEFSQNYITALIKDINIYIFDVKYMK